jgi:hypothetical protein
MGNSTEEGTTVFMDLDCANNTQLEVSSLILTWNADRSADFIELLQQGFQLGLNAEASIREVICGQFGVTHEYLDKRVNTIFLNGKPVDDVDSAMISAGSTLALSAAMPGFVGAALRKGGFYARMRQEITHDNKESWFSGGSAFFVLKLYNLVAKELGPLFLEWGILIRRRDLERFFARRSPKFWSGCLRRVINGREIASAAIGKGAWLGKSELIHFRSLDENAES